MVDVVTKRNYFYQTAYHVIWCPKYRRDVLIGAVAEDTESDDAHGVDSAGIERGAG